MGIWSSGLGAQPCRGTPERSQLRWLLLILLILGLLLVALAACNPAPQAQANMVKLAVEADGIYSVSAAALARVGFDLADVRAEDLSLTTGGAPVALQLVGQGRERALRFYGQALGPEAYTGRNIYWLSHQTTEGSAALISERAAAPATDVVPATVVTDTLRVEERRFYRGQARPGENRWYWQALFAPAETTITLEVPKATADPAVLRLGVYGNSSSAAVDPDHHLALSLNGSQVSDIHWDGAGPYVSETILPAGVLRAGENRLTLTAPGDTGAAVDSIQLEWVEVIYRRELVAERDALTWTGHAPSLAVRSASRPAAVWDITDPAAPVALAGYDWEGGLLRFRSDDTPRRFIVAPEAGLRQPVAITAASGLDLRDWPGGADMIIVTVPTFRGALEPLVAARQAQGLRVVVVDVEQAYDAFNHGRAGPDAIKALVQHALTAWAPPAPRFLLLAGDASYDPRGYLKGVELDLVPTQAVHTTFSGWTGSDVWYAMPDEGPSARPALAVGRFPAQTAEQLADMVAKTLAYERGEGNAAWRSQAFLVADNDERGFADEVSEFALRLEGYTSQEVVIEGDGSAARDTLLRAFDEGRGLIGYFGHGSVTLWAQEKVFGIEDVAKLTNRNRLPVVFTVTCLSGFFEHPNTPSLGEALLRAKDGGAVAALVPSSAAVLPDQRLLSRELASALSKPADRADTLGEAVRQAQAGLPERLGGVREILLTFNLLGDPALRLQ